MIFVLDNYDSFTYNLVHMLFALDSDVRVARNRDVSPGEILSMNPDAIVLSPGPGRPDAAGCMEDLIRAAAGRIPMLGVCLGHQAIGEVFGAQVVPAMEIMHGKTSLVRHDGKGLFRNVRQGFKAVRYHSLALSEASLPECLEVTARTEDGEIMGVRHKEFLIEGMQYHPESIMTTTGKIQLSNFVEMAKERKGAC